MNYVEILQAQTRGVCWYKWMVGLMVLQFPVFGAGKMPGSEKKSFSFNSPYTRSLHGWGVAVTDWPKESRANIKKAPLFLYIIRHFFQGSCKKGISLVSVSGMVSIRHLEYRNPNRKDSLFLSSLDFAWSYMGWFHLYSAVLEHWLQLCTGSRFLWPGDLKVDSHQHAALSRVRSWPRGWCCFAEGVLCLSPGFSKFFLGETYKYLFCHTHRLSSEAERGSAQSFHKSALMNQREDSKIHIKCSAKEDVESSV